MLLMLTSEETVVSRKSVTREMLSKAVGKWSVDVLEAEKVHIARNFSRANVTDVDFESRHGKQIAIVPRELESRRGAARARRCARAKQGNEHNRRHAIIV